MIRPIMYTTLNDIKNEIKWFYQRMTRGYDDSAIWNLNDYVRKTVYKPLKAFVKNYEEHGMSLPSEFATDPNAWLFILKDIEYAFDDWYKEMTDDDYKPYMWEKEKREEHYKHVARGYELFGKYLADLWD